MGDPPPDPHYRLALPRSPWERALRARTATGRSFDCKWNLDATKARKIRPWLKIVAKFSSFWNTWTTHLALGGAMHPSCIRHRGLMCAAPSGCHLLLFCRNLCRRAGRDKVIWGQNMGKSEIGVIRSYFTFQP